MLRPINMQINYKFANNIIHIFDSPNFNEIDNKLDLLVTVNYSSKDEFIKNVIHYGKDSILKPQKNTILHEFIEGYLTCHLMHERYFLLDTLCDDFEEELIINFFDEQYELLKYFNTFPKDYMQVIELYDEEYPNHNYKDTMSELYDTYIEHFYNFIQQIIESIFYLLFENKQFLFNFNKYMSLYYTKEYLPDIFFSKTDKIKRCNYIP